MEARTFFLLMSGLGLCFLACALYIGSTVTKEQADKMKEGDSSTLTNMQNQAVNLAFISFYGVILVAIIAVCEGMFKWLAAY